MDFACDDLLSELDDRGLPAFGVCLGLQAMVEHAGGELSLLAEPAHGKPGVVQVQGGELLSGLPAEFTGARYHSIYARPEQVKGGFEVTATTPDGVVMAIEDPVAGRWGVQFHPESILTASGRAATTSSPTSSASAAPAPRLADATGTPQCTRPAAVAPSRSPRHLRSRSLRRGLACAGRRVVRVL